MSNRFTECFEEAKDEESAAECIHCLRKHGEAVMFSQDKGRIILGRESWDKTVSGEMERISGLLGINSSEKYKEMDEKYNLTMY